MRLGVLLFFILMASAGCSKRSWIARFYAVKAEGLYGRAAGMKARKVAYEKRLQLYREACTQYGKAFETDKKVFTLARISEALDACWRAENDLWRERFGLFEAEYAKEHPDEYEYGDAGVGMVDMGG